jgi:hypothetical protein
MSLHLLNLVITGFTITLICYASSMVLSWLVGFRMLRVFYWVVNAPCSIIEILEKFKLCADLVGLLFSSSFNLECYSLIIC